MNKVNEHATGDTVAVAGPRNCQNCRNRPRSWNRIEMVGAGIRHEGFCRRRNIMIVPEERSGCGQWAACPTAKVKEGVK